MTKSKDLEQTLLNVNIPDTDKILTNIDQENCVITFTLDDGVVEGTYTASISCGDATPVNVTINVAVPEISLSADELNLDTSDPLTSVGTISVTKSASLSDEDISIVVTGSQTITTSVNQTTGVITIDASNETTEGEYTATISCGSAEPKTLDINVTVPVPTITANPTSLTIDLSAEESLFGTTTITKSSELAQEDLTVEISGTSNITTSIDQSTGVITFTANRTQTIIGNYVATISCGSAEPIEVTITVVAPAVTNFTGTSQVTTRELKPSNNWTYTFYLSRQPSYSQGDFTVTPSADAEYFEITINQHSGNSGVPNHYNQAEVTVHKTAAGQYPNTSLQFKCGDVTKIQSISYSAT